MLHFFNLFQNYIFYFILTNIVTIFSTDTQCPYSPINPDDRRINKSSIRLVQYNIEWMFYNEYSGCPGKPFWII